MCPCMLHDRSTDLQILRSINLGIQIQKRKNKLGMLTERSGPSIGHDNTTHLLHTHILDIEIVLETQS
jgi:hypothetical protein